MPCSPNAQLNYIDLVGEHECEKEHRAYDFIAAHSGDLIEKSEASNVEHGFSVCRDGNRLKIHKVCVGEESCIKIEKCESDNIADFHTHPRDGFVDFSIADVAMILRDTENNDDFAGGCVGAAKGILCFKPKDELVRKFGNLVKQLFLSNQTGKPRDSFGRHLAMSQYPNEDYGKVGMLVNKVIRTRGDFGEKEDYEYDIFDVEDIAQCMRLYNRRVPRKPR